MSDVKLPSSARAASIGPSRLTAHAAAQVPAAPGVTRLPDEGDFQHTNLGWHDATRALLGRPVEGVRAGLRVHDLTWIKVGDDDRVLGELAVAGHTVQEGLDWFGPGLELGDWERPGHPAMEGATFEGADADDLEELARWFAIADGSLGRLRGADARASEVRCWPHHFDIATLITLDPDADAEKARSVGVGMTPGDGGIAEPYVYVTPWPYPDASALPDLPVGAWNTEGWVGAVLRGSDMGERPDVRFAAFVGGALDACLTLLEGDG